MPFINELVPEEEKARFPYSVHTRRYGSKPTLWKWTIDKEKNVFLALTSTLGGAYEGTREDRYYILSIDGNPVSMEASRDPVKRTENGLEVTWNIRKLDIPSDLLEKRDVVINLIQEAFRALGNMFNGEAFSKVHVVFS